MIGTCLNEQLKALQVFLSASSGSVTASYKCNWQAENMRYTYTMVILFIIQLVGWRYSY